MKRPVLRFRHLVLLALLIAFTWLVVSRFANLNDVAITLSQGRWDWIVFAILLHLVYYGLYARLYQSGFQVVEVKSRARELLPIVFASIFVNAVAPAGGAGGAALYVDNAIRHHQSGARAAVGTVLVLLADLGTLIPFIAVGELYLYWGRDLQAYDVLAGLIFLFFLGALAGALVLARWQRSWLLRWATWLQEMVNRVGHWFRRPDLLSSNWAERNAAELAEGADAIVRHPRSLGRTLLFGFVLHLINLAGLAMLFLAFRQPVEFGTLIAGFSLGIVFWVVAIIPAGIGIVEGIMALVFTSRGIPGPSAVAIALAFRGLNFWLPLLLGFLLLPHMQTFFNGSSPRTAEARPISKESEG